MKKSLLIYGNLIGTLVLGFLIFAVWTIKFNKPNIAQVVVKKIKKKIEKKLDNKQLKNSKVKITTAVKNNKVDSGINNSTLNNNKAKNVVVTNSKVDSAKKDDKAKNLVTTASKVDSAKKDDKAKNLVTTASKVDSAKQDDKVVKNDNNSNKNNSKAKPAENKSEEEEIVSLDEALSVAQESVENREKLAKEAEINRKLQKILSDKIFIPYRGAKVVGPSGDEMPTMIAPKSLELVGICALGGQEGAMIVVPQRKKLDKAEVLKKLQEVGSNEWAKWMVDNYMQRGQRKTNIEMPGGDAKTAAEWKAKMDDIINEMEYNKIFFAIGEEVYDEYILTGLLIDGVVLSKGSQEYFLPMVSNSRSVSKRNKNEVRQQIRTLWGQWSYLTRQRSIMQRRNSRAKQNAKGKSKKKSNSFFSIPYNFGQGESPKW